MLTRWTSKRTETFLTVLGVQSASVSQDLGRYAALCVQYLEQQMAGVHSSDPEEENEEDMVCRDEEDEEMMDLSDQRPV
ncbi:hypothetical protein DPEC_G00317540 [Dallia pectoralis]|uniref:Uncharacterized protein n=1 Tax=Dallia pectoralis TaxID=75939 RepID=A0ACC2FDB7_DALPE|nr:hypothetical protein DPEC_G00317540 [Dallia pectoralis]